MDDKLVVCAVYRVGGGVLVLFAGSGSMQPTMAGSGGVHKMLGGD